MSEVEFIVAESRFAVSLKFLEQVRTLPPPFITPGGWVARWGSLFSLNVNVLFFSGFQRLLWLSLCLYPHHPNLSHWVLFILEHGKSYHSNFFDPSLANSDSRKIFFPKKWISLFIKIPPIVNHYLQTVLKLVSTDGSSYLFSAYFLHFDSCSFPRHALLSSLTLLLTSQDYTLWGHWAFAHNVLFQ